MDSQADTQIKELIRVAVQSVITSVELTAKALNDAGFSVEKIEEIVAQAEKKDKLKRLKNEAWYEQQQREHTRRFKRY